MLILTENDYVAKDLKLRVDVFVHDLGGFLNIWHHFTDYKLTGNLDLSNKFGIISSILNGKENDNGFSFLLGMNNFDRMNRFVVTELKQ